MRQYSWINVFRSDLVSCWARWFAKLDHKPLSVEQVRQSVIKPHKKRAGLIHTAALLPPAAGLWDTLPSASLLPHLYHTPLSQQPQGRAQQPPAMQNRVPSCHPGPARSWPSTASQHSRSWGTQCQLPSSWSPIKCTQHISLLSPAVLQPLPGDNLYSLGEIYHLLTSS